MANSAIYKNFFDVEGIVAEAEEAELTLRELQELVVALLDLPKRVAKLERLHAKF